MFYSLLKIYGRLAIKIYCRKVVINKPAYLHLKGPLLLAANHPNSFLDGMILTTLFDEPVYALARGDAFKNNFIAKILHWLRQLPVYRTSEGTDNLKNNYITFAACHQKFKEGNIVVIFSEACSVNEWHLRPLRKGTARLAITSWRQNIPLKVLPVGINYDSFKSFGKEVHINFGEFINKNVTNEFCSTGIQLNEFNHELNNQLRTLVYEINSSEEHQKFFIRTPLNTKAFALFLSGIIGAVLHWPLYFLCWIITKAWFQKSDHYDSVLHSLLFITYPLYIFLLIILAWPIAGIYSLSAILVLPVTAWSWQQLRGFVSKYKL